MEYASERRLRTQPYISVALRVDKNEKVVHATPVSPTIPYHVQISVLNTLLGFSAEMSDDCVSKFTPHE